MLFQKLRTAQVKDCFVSVAGDIVTVGTGKLSRSFDIAAGAFLEVTDRVSGRIYSSVTPVTVPVLDPAASACTLTSAAETNCGAGTEHLSVTLTYTSGDRSLDIRFELFPGLPFIVTKMTLETGGGAFEPVIDKSTHPAHTDFERSQILDAVSFGGRHREMTAYSLYDCSDERDQPVRRQTSSLYFRGRHDEWGNIFHITDLIDRQELLLVKNSPVCQSHLAHNTPDLRIEGDMFYICGGGIDYRSLPAGRLLLYHSTVGIGTGLMRSFRDLARAVNPGCGTLFAMENTWGDRSCDKKLCDAFIRREIDAAEKIGVDIVQIDDGWAKGTVDTQGGFETHIWQGYYTAAPDFWAVSEKKFPNGFGELSGYAKAHGVALGLWFSPDSENEFVHWEDDVGTLYGFYEKYGISWFKLDGITMHTKAAERRMALLLSELDRRSGGRIQVQLDVTSGRRFGFLYQRGYGTLFVENRYTDWANYYPHATLRNLWALSEILPARAFQFEFLNHRRNPENYGDDPLAPANYSIDYLFAVTMMANPLVWMELSELDSRDIPALSRIVGVWRQHRDALYHADVTPIGEKPTGFSFTGFYADCGRTGGYALLFRELTKAAAYTYSIPQLAEKSYDITVLDAPKHAVLSAAADGITAVFDESRSYVFARISCRPPHGQ